MQPGPEVDRLGVRVVDPEDAYAVAHPQLEDAQALGVDAVPVGVEVDRVDVLVLLRRVLRVRDRTVGPVGEPLRMLGHPRMVGRGLQGEVHRDLQAEGLGLGHEPVERLEVAQVGMDGVVAALLAADRPRRPGIARARGQRVVRALAELVADRVDRRQVDHVEAHRRRRFEPLVRGVEGARLPGLGLLVELRTLGAGEELVPGGEQRLPAIHVDGVVRGGGDQLARSVRAHRRPYVIGQHHLQPVLDLLAGVQALGRPAEQRGDLRRAGALRPVGGGREERLALGADQGDVDAGRDLDLGVVHPGLPRVTPALDPERPVALGLQHDRGGPPVEAGGGGPVHRFDPFLAPGIGQHDGGIDRVVALSEDLRADGDRFTHRGLGRVGAALDHRGHLDHRDPADQRSELGFVDGDGR